MFTVSISSQSRDSIKAIEKYFEMKNWNDQDFELGIQNPTIKFRSSDPALILAIIGVLGSGLGAVINGIAQVLKQNSAKKIIIQTSKGNRLEVPANISEKKNTVFFL